MAWMAAKSNCPRCGYPDDPGEYVLTEIERMIIETLRDVRRSPLSPVSSRVLADVLGYSQQYIQEHLTRLHRRGIVSLPRGRCSGWVEGDVLKELAAIISGCTHLT
jgi:DNA-binding IscR family transcriptional regulator